MSAWTVEHVDVTGSTMDDARAKAHAGAPDRWAIVANQMTGGRGTHGRPWLAPPGGLYTSFVLRDVPNPSLLTLALGNAVADVLEVAGVEPRVKWVNDVLVNDRKVAGILVEGEATGSHLDVVVAGIGINVNGSTSGWPSDVAARATTLEQELGCDSCIPDLETFLWQSVDRWLETLVTEPSRIITVTRARDALVGRQVTVDDGERTAGIAEGIDDHGHLRLRVGGAMRTFSTGTVELH